MRLVVQVLRWVVGLLLIGTVLLKEDAEQRVQSRVESWWLALAYGQEAALSKATSFLRMVARLTGSVFDCLFGGRLFSLRGFGVSVCYSVASFFLCVQLLGLSPSVKTPMSFEGWLFFLLFLFLGSIPALREHPEDEVSLVWGAVLITVILIPLVRFMDFLIQKPQTISAAAFVVFVVLVLAISSGSDFCYIALTRWMLRKASELRHWIGILGIVLLDCLLGLILFLGPALLGVLVIAKVGRISQVSLVAVGVMLFGPALNTIDFLACSLFFVLMVVVLVHRLLWPALEGPIYVFQRYGLIRHKGWLVAAGVGLLFGKGMLAVLLELVARL